MSPRPPLSRVGEKVPHTMRSRECISCVRIITITTNVTCHTCTIRVSTQAEADSKLTACPVEHWLTSFFSSSAEVSIVGWSYISRYDLQSNAREYMVPTIELPLHLHRSSLVLLASLRIFVIISRYLSISIHHEVSWSTIILAFMAFLSSCTSKKLRTGFLF